MRKPVLLCCLAMLCLAAAALAPPADAATRGDSSRADAGALAGWRADVRLERQLARLFGLLPFAPPAPAPVERDDEGPVRGGLGLSDDPDPTGSRGDGGGGGDEGDDEEDSVNSGDQPMSTDEHSVRQLRPR